MSLRPYYTINASLLVKQKKGGFDITNSKLNILLSKETEFTPDLYTALASIENEYIISLGISLLQDRDLPQNLLSKIYLLLVLNRCSKGRTTIPIFSETKYQEESLNIEKIQTYLNQQGLLDVKFPIFDYSGAGTQTIDNCSLFIMPDQSAGLPNVIPGTYEYSTIMIIAAREQITDFTGFVDLKAQVIAAGRNNFHDDISQFYMEKAEFESERELWKKRALLYQDFLSLSKKVQEKEYYDVLNWYQKEYEVLPLWYKRFGHIVKVMIGKRRFRSLFSDNGKKEKE